MQTPGPASTGTLAAPWRAIRPGARPRARSGRGTPRNAAECWQPLKKLRARKNAFLTAARVGRASRQKHMEGLNDAENDG